MAKYNLENNPLFASQEPEEDQDLDRSAKKRVGRPRKAEIVRDNSVQEGLTEEYTRATFILEVELLERFKNYAYTQRLSMKNAINKAFTEFLDSEEKRLAKQGIKILDRKGGN